MKKEIAIDALKNAGFDVTKLFAPGTSFQTTDHGTIIFEEDEVSKGIEDAGAINSPRLFRRWVMAQMFRALKYEAWNGQGKGYDAYYRLCFPYDYQWKTTLNEIRAINKIKDVEEYNKRTRFFTKDVIISMAKDYERKLGDYIRSKGRVDNDMDVRVNGILITKNQINKIHEIIERLQYSNYRDLEINVRLLMKVMIPLPKETPKAAAWKSAFKGEGAYYTLQNLVMFHGLRVRYEDSAEQSMDYVEELTNMYARSGEWYKLFAFMKKLIEDNNYDFYKDMAHKYGRKYYGRYGY